MVEKGESTLDNIVQVPAQGRVLSAPAPAGEGDDLAHGSRLTLGGKALGEHGHGATVPIQALG